MARWGSKVDRHSRDRSIALHGMLQCRRGAANGEVIEIVETKCMRTKVVCTVQEGAASKNNEVDKNSRSKHISSFACAFLLLFTFSARLLLVIFRLSPFFYLFCFS